MDTIEYTKSIFSLNMEDIVADVGEEGLYPIVIHSEDSPTIAFKLFAIGGKLQLIASDIVESYKKPYEPYIGSENDICIEQKLDRVSLQIRNESDEFTDKSYAIYTIFGGYDKTKITDEHDFVQHNFLTWRPQTDFVVPGIKQQLSFVIYNVGPNSSVTYPITSRKLFAKIYFRTLPPMIKELAVVDSDLSLYRLDCSYNRIASIVGNEVDDEIVAYDIYGGTDTDIVNCVSIKPQRFVVRPHNSSHSHFFFQNTLGGFDTITAQGESKCIADGEVTTAMTRGVEIEISTDYVRTWEVNTGYITTAQEENLWHEFLRSTNRYILFDDGSYRKIIVEEYKAERVGFEVGSFTFKFHYAEAEKGGFAEKSETLPDFFIK